MAQHPRRMRMSDVAAAAGVSLTTVSLVLNQKAGAIPERTRSRVLKAAADLAYRPNALAAGLRHQASETIGFVSDFIASTPHAGALVQGAQDAAWKAGKLLLMVNTEGDSDVENRALESLLARQVDGLIYASMYHHIVEIPAVAFEVPCVLLDARSSDLSISSVAPDEHGGGFVATNHLLEHGHTRIGFIGSVDPIPAATERLDGYRDALAAHSVAFDARLVEKAAPDHEGGYEAAKRMLEQSDRPTALFCFNDQVAAGASRAARESGLRIPRDLSLVGFDNQALVALLIDPPITTVQLPHYEMGRWAVEHLLRQIDVPSSTAPEQHRMPCPLVSRRSVAAPTKAEDASVKLVNVTEEQ